MKFLGSGLASVLLVAWVGGLWAIGYIAAPSLFAHLADKELAGNLAGNLFKWIAYVGMTAGAYLLIYRLGQDGLTALKGGFFWAVLAMLALTLAQRYGFQPVMQSLKEQALPRAVMESAFRSRFVAWHGISSIVYLMQSLIGLWLVARSKLA